MYLFKRIVLSFYVLFIVTCNGFTYNRFDVSFEKVKYQTDNELFLKPNNLDVCSFKDDIEIIFGEDNWLENKVLISVKAKCLVGIASILWGIYLANDSYEYYRQFGFPKGFPGTITGISLIITGIAIQF